VLLGVALAVLFPAAGVAVAGTNWSVSLASGSHAEGQSAALPAAPGGVTVGTFTCTGSQHKATGTISWNSVAKATSYDSGWSTSSNFSQPTTYNGTGTTSPTMTVNGLNTATTIYFAVRTDIGNNWQGSYSSTVSKSLGPCA
jgi:hypothetical protein